MKLKFRHDDNFGNFFPPKETSWRSSPQKIINVVEKMTHPNNFNLSTFFSLPILLILPSCTAHWAPIYFAKPDEVKIPTHYAKTLQTL